LVLRLLRLLLHRASRKLRLTALQGSLLRASAKPSKPLTDTGTNAIQALAESRSLLRRLRPLAIKLLPQRCLLLGSRHALTKTLLANAEELLRRLLLRLPVGLLSLQRHALLLLGSAKRLPIALLIDVPKRLGRGKVLLLRQIGLGDLAAITTKGAAADLVPNDLLLFLLLLLPQSLISRLRHSFSVGRHIRPDIQAARRYLPRTSQAIPGGQSLIRLRASLGASNVLGSRSLERRRRRLTTIKALRGLLIIRLRLRRAAKQRSAGALIIGLSHTSGLTDIGNPGLLGAGKRSNKLPAIWRKRYLGDCFSPRIDRIIPGENFRRYRYR
jgi:hypothetical protein